MPESMDFDAVYADRFRKFFNVRGSVCLLVGILL